MTKEPNLSPAGATLSLVIAMNGSQQAGFAKVSGIDRASLWNGTAASWIDLHPVGATESYVRATIGSHQAGYVMVGGTERASLWSGTAASWVDLHNFLPAGYDRSNAWGISNDGINLYVTGRALHTATGTYQAMLWTQPIPEPGTAGLLCLGGVLALLRRHKTA